jgi:hypothetical protein
MSGKLRYVFDTNVTVSAVLFEQSSPGQALQAALTHGELLLSRGQVSPSWRKCWVGRSSIGISRGRSGRSS